jgi:hypothetical protein
MMDYVKEKNEIVEGQIKRKRLAAVRQQEGVRKQGEVADQDIRER